MKKVTTAISILITFSLLLFGYLYFYEPKSIERKINNKLKEISLLTTGEDIYKEVIYSKTTGDIFWIPIKNKEFLLSINYKITTGIDLSKGFNVAHKGSYTELILPYPQVVQIDADDLSIKEYFTKERFSSIKRDDYFAIINETKAELLESEEIKELLLESSKNAELIIRSLLEVGGITMKVSFK